VTDPDISVLMPSYNYGRFLRDAIDSVLAQTGPTIELIVQDGESTDDTIEILESYGDRIKWESGRDENQSDALNKALARARGRWIAWLNVDEFYLPGALAKLYGLTRRSNTDLIYGDAVFVDEAGKVLRLLPQHPFRKLVLEQYGTFISTCAMVFRKDSVPPQPFDTSLGRVMDWDLFLQVQRRGGNFEYVPYPVAAFRIHDEQITAGAQSAAFPEHARLRAKYGIRRSKGSKAIGYAAHAALKWRAGSYRRQRCAERLGGTDLRWFGDNDQGLKQLHDCYGIAQS
jgi:glycosyltransferase involved in cell wall biosynthesis